MRKIPLALKIAGACFLAVMLPVYLVTYGPTNFLWFCDAALILTIVGMWLESPLLISMCATGILVPQTLWLVDFFLQFFGLHLVGLTAYMFDKNLPLFIRGLSLFHGWLPILLLWLVHRVGYDRRGLPAWTILSVILVLLAYKFTLPAGAHPANPNLPINVNNIYGFDNDHPQHLMNQHLYLVCWLAALWLVAYFPTHLALKRFCRAPFKSSRMTMLKTYDPRLGQDFRLESPNYKFSSVENNFFVFDGTWEPDVRALHFLNGCIVETSTLGFFVVTPLYPKADTLIKRLRQDFRIASEIEGSFCGYFEINPVSVQKLFLLREEFKGLASGEWGIGGCLGHFAPPTRRGFFGKNAWNLFHLSTQPAQLGCLLYLGEMQQGTLVSRLYEGFDPAAQNVWIDARS